MYHSNILPSIFYFFGEGPSKNGGSIRAIDKECGSNDDHLPAQGLGHDKTSYTFLSSFQFLCQTKNNSIDRMIKK